MEIFKAIAITMAIILLVVLFAVGFIMESKIILSLPMGLLAAIGVWRLFAGTIEAWGVVERSYRNNRGWDADGREEARKKEKCGYTGHNFRFSSDYRYPLFRDKPGYKHKVCFACECGASYGKTSEDLTAREKRLVIAALALTKGAK